MSAILSAARADPPPQAFTVAGCPDINMLPAGRLDANAIKLLNLYPLPTNGASQSNFASSPNLYEHRNAFDIRVDFDLTQKDQIFFRFSYVDDPQFIPGPFGGVADGGGFQQGDPDCEILTSLPRPTPTYFRPPWSTWRGRGTTTFTPRASARRAPVPAFRRNTEFRVSRSSLKMAVFPPSRSVA